MGAKEESFWICYFRVQQVEGGGEGNVLPGVERQITSEVCRLGMKQIAKTSGSC